MYQAPLDIRPKKPLARVVADSISPEGIRLTSMVIRLWRPLTAQFNTVRLFSRNSSSSRAIPISTQLLRLDEDVAWPMSWPKEKPGMQGGDELTGQDLLDAQQLFIDSYYGQRGLIEAYLEAHPDLSTRLHKSYINRLIEVYMWQEILVTATEWENFFDLRSSRKNKETQFEFMATADKMIEVMAASTPTEIDYGQWHRPFVFEGDDKYQSDRDYIISTGVDPDSEEGDGKQNAMCTARGARISYMTHDNRRDQIGEIGLHDELFESAHASPFEHIATPSDPKVLIHKGNFRGWDQYRHLVGLY